ncbi:glycosyltransferase family 4 protein [Novosphingobium profundi]|uniref:glycosyltransferase family 4 protein n=1 Tax=Novosphingobium profundi TaxID=1774954 RepID=UPI001BDAB194|nr:glycosyltransferase family 4 protein [Novosphingobium profundi]MBT0668353.1 glycosyltransferase family 4 protein [Novosphingobium profundi]
MRQHEPELAIVVERGVEFRNPYQAKLLPMLRMYKKKLKRVVDGTAYETYTKLPLPDLSFGLRRLAPQAVIMVEFTPVALMSLLACLTMPATARIQLVESDPRSRGASRNPLVLKMKRWMVGKMDIIQTNTPEGRDYLVDTLGAPPQRVRVAPYLSSHPPGPPSRPHDPQGPVNLLFANSLTRRKGLDRIVAALSACDPATRQALRLIVIGDGPERAALEESVRASALEEIVTFVGRKSYDEMGPYFAEADVLLVPSLADYRSLASFEGLSFGLALIASKFDGASRETVVDGRNGYVIDPDDIGAIARSLTALVGDRAHLQECRNASSALFAAKYSIPQIAQNLHDSLEAARARRRARAR